MSRPEQFLGLAQHIQGIDRILRIYSMERILEAAMQTGKKKEALKVAEIFFDMEFERFPHTIDDLREAIEKLELENHVELPELTRNFLKLYIRQILPVAMP